MENQTIEQKNQENDELFEELAKYPENYPEYQNIVAKIVNKYIHLVPLIARSCFPTIKADKIFSSEDLIVEGYFALLRGIKTFKLERGVPFKNYVTLKIKGYMLDYYRHEAKRKSVSLEDEEDGIKDALMSPINLEEDIITKDETDRRMNWVRENLDQLSPKQKKVLTARYLSGEAIITGDALAEKFACTQPSIAAAEHKAFKRLREIYYAAHPEEIVPKAEFTLTSAEKIALKSELKALIATQLHPQQRKIMLHKFYSATPKTDEQVAQEMNLTKQTVATHISRSCKKLYTLCDSIKDKKHLKKILEFIPEENEKVC